MDAFGFRRQASSKKMSWHLLADIQVFTSPIQSSNGSQLQLRIAWIPVVLVIQFLIVIHHYLSFGRIISSSKCFYPHLCVGFLFLILYPAASAGSSSSSSASSPSSITHNFFVTHHLSHTSLSHTTLSPTMFHIQLCHTLSFTHTQLSHTPSFTHNFVTHTHHLSSSHTIFHIQLCHKPSFATPSFTHHFVTHHLSHTTLSHALFHTHTTFTHTIFHTQLCHTHYLSWSHTIFHIQLCHIQLCFTCRSSTTSFVFPSFPAPATTFPLASSFGSQWAQSRSVAISPGSRTGTVAREILMAMEPQPSWLMLQGARLNWLNLKLDPKNVEDIMSYPVIIIIYQLNCRSSMCVFRGLTEKQENTCQWMSCQPQKHASEILPVGCCSWFSWCPKFKDLSQVSQKMEGKQ